VKERHALKAARAKPLRSRKVSLTIASNLKEKRMNRQVFFLHSAGAQGPHEGSSDFVGWLTDTLGSACNVLYPKMPNPEEPDYESWKAELRKELAKLGGELTFVGHSLGGSVLLKYLVEEPFKNPIAGMFLVSVPFWGGDEDWQHESFRLPKDFARKLPRIPRIYLYHSVNDPIVPFAHHRLYAEALPHATIRKLKGNEHTFSQGLPELAADIQRLKETTSSDYQ
jgi:predicted alpha/beta hydrolase family esterase